jgi:glycosyltransferase involved in cell wall biosynthesis
MPHICLIVSFYPDATHPYAGRFFREHAEALSDAGYTVSVLYPSLAAFSSVKTLAPEISVSKEKGITVIRSQATVLAQRFSFLNAKALKRAFHEAYRQLESTLGKPDFCLAETGFPPAVFAEQLHEKKGIPFGIIDHFSFSARMFREHADEWQHIYPKARFCAAVSPMLQRVVRAATDFRFPVEVLPNCLSKVLLELPVSPMSNRNTFSWIWIGRNHPVKKPEKALEAIALLPPNHTLTMVGLDNTDALASTLNEQNHTRVRFVDGMPAEKLWPLMEAHDALLCTSEMETFGMAPLEMLAMGRPVVTTPCGGPEQFVTETNGRVTAGLSVQAIADAMLECSQTVKTDFDCNKVARDVRSRFSPEAFARTFAALAKC